MKSIQKDKENRIAKTIVKKNKVGELILPDFKTSLKVYSSRSCSTGQNSDKETDRKDSLETEPHKHDQVISDKGEFSRDGRVLSFFLLLLFFFFGLFVCFLFFF